jgi:hypothetical protein
MAFVYNNSYYHDGKLHQLRPRAIAINTYVTEQDGLVIGMFQGKRGPRPELDFKVKILRPGKDNRPIPPPHIFWVVDLMLKIDKYKTEVTELITYYIKFYDKIFKIPSDRNNYIPKTVKEIHTKYSYIEDKRTLSIEYCAYIIELFCINEKLYDNAFMFRNLLETIHEYTQGKVDYLDVLNASRSGYR